MRVQSYIALAVIILGVPVMILTAIYFAPAVEQPQIEELYVNATAEELLLQTHELPKYRPPLNWNRIFKGPAGDDTLPGFISGVSAVYGRRTFDERTNQIFYLEQASQKVFTFKTFDNAQAYYDSRLEELSAAKHDVVFETLNTRVYCKGFYNRTDTSDIIIAPCKYGNVFFEAKAISRDFVARSRAVSVIGVTMDKIAGTE